MRLNITDIHVKINVFFVLLNVFIKMYFDKYLFAREHIKMHEFSNFSLKPSTVLTSPLLQAANIRYQSAQEQ